MEQQIPKGPLKWKRKPVGQDAGTELLPSQATSEYQSDTKSPQSHDTPARSTSTATTVAYDDGLVSPGTKQPGSPTITRTPTAPMPLRRWTISRKFFVFWDILLCFVPVSFLVLAGLVAQLDGQPVSNFGQRIVEWSLLGPTIFPIFFAAIVGRTMKFVAHWKLEQGAKLETLEKLVGSQSVFGAIFTQLALQGFGFLSLGIILIWAFSPLGGQAPLRIIGTDFTKITNTTELAYLNMTRQITGFQAGYSTAQSIGAINALYLGSLIGPKATKLGSQDTWGNVKIPYMERIDTSPDEDGWKTVPSNASYTSLVGLPIAGIPTNANSTFNLRSYYYNVDCQKLEAINTTGNWLAPLKIPGVEAKSSGINETTIFSSKGLWRFYLGTFNNYTLYQGNMTGKGRIPMTIAFLQRSGVNNTGATQNATFANCTMEPSFVESQVSCLTGISGTKCAVDKIRNDTSVHLPWDYRYSYSVPLLSPSEQWTIFAESFAAASESGSQFASSPAEQYMGGDEYFPFAKAAGLTALYNQTKSDFSRRLGELMNTYWITSLAPEASTGNLGLVPVSDLLTGNTSLAGNFFDLAVNGTTATTTHLLPIYSCNRGWLTALILASMIMFVLGVGGTLLKYLSFGPDILGYVSSIVVESSHVGVGPEVASHMDGLEKTKWLGGLRVRLEDIRGSEAVGRIAIVPLRGTEDEGRRLREKRLYA